MEIEENTPKINDPAVNPQSQNSNQNQTHQSKSQNNATNNKNNNTTFQQTQKIELDPKALEMLKKYQKNYPTHLTMKFFIYQQDINQVKLSVLELMV